MLRVFIVFLAVLAGTSRLTAAGEPDLTVSWLDGGLAWVRISSLTADFNSQLNSGLTNRPTGLVLDLRFADGPSAALAHPPALPQVPVVVLVNGQTRGPAAQWAEQLRGQEQAVLIGSTNLAGVPVPDVAVTVKHADEQWFWQHPFTVPNTTTNAANTLVDSNFLPFIDHTSEAELVQRRLKDGDEEAAEAPRTLPTEPLIQDPALARAVDLLKAIQLLRLQRG